MLEIVIGGIYFSNEESIEDKHRSSCMFKNEDFQDFLQDKWEERKNQ